MTRDQFAALAGGIELLERAINYALGSLHLVTPDALTRPSTCEEWDLMALLSHVDDSLAAINEAVEVGVINAHCAPVEPRADPFGHGRRRLDPVASLRDRACRILGAWTNADDLTVVCIGDRLLTTGIVTTTGALEVAVHGWDIAETCGRAQPIPGGLARELLEIAPLIVSDVDRPVRFGAPLDIPADAGAGRRLLAYLGRSS